VSIIRKQFVLLIALFCVITTAAQSTSNSVPLRTVFHNFESQFGHAFSYEDAAISNHMVEGILPTDYIKALEFLRKKTLFEYRVLNSKTIAVRLRESVIPLCVVVSEESTENRVENAIIKTSFQEVKTDENGQATLLSEERSMAITIKATAVAQEIYAIAIQDKPNCTAIRLLPETEMLEPILLSNYLTKGIEKSWNGDVIINYKRFDILPGLIEPDVLLTLQALPGVSSINETVSFLNIRGGTNDQNLILWDGIKMYKSGHFFGQISAFNSFLTQKVTLIKNGSSARYGDGVSGIIAMESNPTRNETLYGGLGFNLLSADAFADTPLGKKASVEVAARKSINNLVKTPTYNQYFEKVFQNTEVLSTSESESNSHDDFTFFDTSIRLIYEPTSEDYVRANLMFIGNRLDFLENAEIDNTLFSRQSELDQSNVSAGLFYKRTWSQNTTTEVQLYGSNYSLGAVNFDILNNQRLLQTNTVLETGASALTTFSLTKNIALTGGYQFNETGITNFEQLNNPLFEVREKQVLRTHSLFSEIGYNAKNTSVKAGLRVNHFSKFNNVTIEPRLSFNQRFLKYFSFEILGELKSQTTSQIIDFQNDFLGVENRKWVLSNPNEIPILKGQQISTGVSFNRKNLLITIEPYLKHVDGITSQSQGFQNQFQEAKTTGSYTVKGIDFLVSKQFRKINTWLSYSWADNKYTFEDLSPETFHNNLDVRHTLTYGINYSWKTFKLSGGLNWHSGKPTTTLVAENEIVAGDLNFNSPNQENIKDYLRVDISLLYDFKVLSRYKARFGLSVWNLLDTQNTINHFYRLNHSENLEELDESALRFTPNATLRVWF